MGSFCFPRLFDGLMPQGRVAPALMAAVTFTVLAAGLKPNPALLTGLLPFVLQHQNLLGNSIDKSIISDYTSNVKRQFYQVATINKEF
jgi:hypothetical protein